MNDRTEATRALIARLSRERAVSPRAPSLVLPLAITVATLSAFASVLAFLGPRNDLMLALQGIGGQKVVAGAIVALFAAACFREAAQPDAPSWLGRVLFVGLLAFGIPALLPGAALPTWQMLVTDPAGPVCFMMIVAVAMLPLAVLMAGLRRSAPARPFVAGLAAGALAGGLASCAYALHCTADTVSVASVWYPTSVVAIMLLAGGIGQRCLVW